MGYFSKSAMICLLTLFFYSGIFSVEERSPESSRQELIELLQKWARDFNSKNVQEVCDLFAPDLISSFPGIPDENYEQNCKSLTSVLADEDKIYFYEAPHIQKVIVDCDVGIVKLIWRLKVSDKNNQKTEIITARSLDVFKRQQDGRWKLSISFAYPESTK